MLRAALLVAGLCLSGGARAANPLEAWRSDASMTRILAENDAPRAYERAKRLQETLPADATPADRARALNVLARAESYLGMPTEAAAHARQALELARPHGDRLGQAEANLNLALISVDLAEIDVLVESSTRALALLEGFDRPDLLGEALLRTSMMYRRMGQVDISVNMSMQAMEVAQQSNDPFALAYANQGLGVAFGHSDRYEEAFEYFTAMREQSRAAGSKLLEAYALVNIASTVGELGDLVRAEAHNRAAIALYRDIDAPFALNFGLFGLAYNFRKRGLYREALPILDEIVERYERYANLIGLWYTLNARSETYLALGNPSAALPDAERSLELAKKIDLSTYRIESLHRIAAVAAAAGSHPRAYALAMEAAQLTDKAAREKISARVVELAENYEAESKRRQIEALTRRNREQAESLQHQAQRQRWLWTVLGGSSAIIAGAAILLFRLRRSHRLLESANTQLHRSQSELQQQTDILRSILDSMGEGVSVANERGTLLLVNPAAEKIVGLGVIQESPDGWTERYGLYLPDRKTPYPTADLPLVKAIRGESCDHAELFVRNRVHHDGRWLSVTARPLKDKAGVARGAVAVFSDITDHKKAEAEIRALNANLERRVQERTAQLEATNRELEAFSYSVSHDLRAPLRSIDGFSRIILEDYTAKLDAEGIEHLNTIRLSSQRMGQLIDDMLRLSKVTRTELHRGPVDLSALAADIAAKLKEEFPAHEVEFVNGPDLLAQADPSLMRIVLENLLGNAWKFTGKQPAARVEFGHSQVPGAPAYFVRDNGVGFDSALIHKLFTAFQRLHTTAEFPGTGIGLATVQRIIHRHGGHVWAESAPGGGATFYFTLPN